MADGNDPGGTGEKGRKKKSLLKKQSWSYIAAGHCIYDSHWPCVAI